MRFFSVKSAFVAAVLGLLAGPALAIDVNNSFAPSSVFPDQEARMKLTFANPDATTVTNLSLSKFMDGVFISATPDIISDCNGILNLTNQANGGQISLSGAVLPSNQVNSGSCSVSFDVITKARGDRTITILAGEATGTSGGNTVSNPQNSSATISTIVGNISGFLQVSHRWLQAGETGKLTYRVYHTNGIPLTNVRLTLPAASFTGTGGLMTPVSSTIASNCGGAGTVDAVSGLNFTIPTLESGFYCAISFDYTVGRDPKATAAFVNFNPSLPIGAVTSNEGAINENTAAIAAGVGSGISVQKLFANSTNATVSIVGNSSIPLELKFNNYNAFGSPPGGGSFTDALPAGMKFDSVVSNSCGATISGQGTGSVTLNNLSVLAAPSTTVSGQEIGACSVVVNTTVAAGGVYTNSVPAGNIGGYNYSSTNATVRVNMGNLAAVVDAYREDGQNQVYLGDHFLVKVRLEETSGTQAISDIRVPITLPMLGSQYDSLVSDNCGGTMGITQGSGLNSDSLVYNGGSIAVGGYCEVVFKVQSTPASTNAFRVSNQVVARVAANTLTYTVNGTSQTFGALISGTFTRFDTPVTTSAAFFPTSTGSGGLSRKTVTLAYSSVDRNAASGLGYVDNLPSGITVAPNPNVTFTPNCGTPNVVAVPGTSSVTVSGISINPMGNSTNCAISFNVKAPVLATGQISGTGSNILNTDPVNGPENNFYGSMTGLPAAYSAYNRIYNGRNTAGTLIWEAKNIQITKAFIPTVVAGGQDVRVRVTLTNNDSNATLLNNISFTDNFAGTGLYVSENPNVYRSCSTGNVTATPNTQQVNVSSLTLPARQNCYIDFNLYSHIGGNHINTIPAGAVQNDQNVTNSEPASATVTILRNLGVAKSFTPETVSLNSPSKLRISIINTNTVTATGQNPFMQDHLAAGLTASNPTTTCSGLNVSVTGTPGNQTLVASGGTFPADSICYIEADVQAQAGGSYANVIAVGDLRANADDGSLITNVNEGKDTLFVVEPIQMTKAPVGPLNLNVGERGEYHISLWNPNPFIDIENISLKDNLPVGMNLLNTSGCGMTSTVNGNEITYNRGYLGADSRCTIVVSVTSNTPGVYPNVATDLTSDYFPTPGAPSNEAILYYADARDLTLDKTFEKDQVVKGDSVNVNLTVNNSTDIPTKFILRDVLPSGLVLAPNATVSGCGSDSIFMGGGNQVIITSPTGQLLANPNSSCVVTFPVLAGKTGNIVNRAYIRDPTGTFEVSDEATLEVVDYDPSYTIEKKIITDTTNPYVVVGKELVWEITVKNTGNVKLTSFDMQDATAILQPQIVSESVLPNEQLDLDETMTFEVKTVISQGEIDEKLAKNTASVKFWGPTDESDAETVEATAEAPLTLNSPPVANDDSYNDVIPGQSVTGLNVTGNDTDVDDNILVNSVVFVENGTKELITDEGTWTVDVFGVVSFQPVQGFYGVPDPVEYQISDSEGLTSTATITINYVPMVPPVAVDDTLTGLPTNQEVTVKVLDNDIVNTLPLDIHSVLINGSTNPILIVPGEGEWNVISNTGDILFRPEPGFTGDPTPITYTVKDEAGNISNEAVVTLDFAVQAPNANDDSVEGPTAGQPVSVSVLNNDSDPDGALNTTSVVIIGAPDDGKTLVVPGEGVWTVDPTTGDVTFTPEDGFYGEPTPISYTVKDNDGNTSSSASVTVTYAEIVAPAAVNDTVSGLETNQPASVKVLDNDFANTLPLDPTSVVIVGASGDGKTLTVAGEGVWTVNTTTGDITFTPESGFTADPSPVSYTVKDVSGVGSNEAVVTFDYAAQSPVANNDVVNGLTTNATAEVDVLGNDSDPDGSLNPASVVIIGAPGDGKTLVVANEGTWTVDPVSGVISFEPETGFTSNPAPIRYVVSDNDGNVSNEASVNLSYDPRLPIAADDTVNNADTGNAVIVRVLDNDNDPDGTLNTSSVIIVESNGKTHTVAGEGVWQVNDADGSITFTPEAGFTSNPTPITYHVSDNDGNVSNNAQVSITYLAEAPNALDDQVVGSSVGTIVSVNVVDNDSDPDGSLDLASVLFNNGSKTLTVSGEGVWTADNAGNVTFTPETGFYGAPTPVTYTVKDNDDNVSNPATITVSYPAIVPPTANPDSVADVTTGTPAVITVIGNDAPGTLPLDPTSVVIVGAPGDGKALTVPGEGVWTVNPTTGVITFTPESGFTADPTPISYTVKDVAGTVSQPAVISVDYAVQAPTAVDDSVEGTAAGSPVTVNAAQNDSDPDGSLDTTSVLFSNGSKTLTVSGEGVWKADNAGNVTFTPETGFYGAPTPVTYTVRDNDGNVSNAATITVSYPAIVPPTANPDSVAGVTTGTPAVITVIGNDAPGTLPLDPTSVVIVGAPGDGKVLTVPGEGVWTVNPITGVITFTPETGFTADPTPISYTVKDTGGNASSPATVSVDYESVVMIAPVARDDSATATAVGTPVSVNVVLNDSDEDGTVMANSVLFSNGTKTLVVSGEGTWTVNNAGSVIFTPEPSFTGNPSPVSYTVRDNQGNVSNTATITVIYPAVTGPDAVNDTGVGTVSQPSTINVLTNDVSGDLRLDPKTVIIVGAPDDGKTLVVSGEGVWTVNPTTGAITFTPDSGFYGDPTPISYNVKDVAGTISDDATVSIDYDQIVRIKLDASVSSIDDVNGNDVNDVGDVVHYQFEVTNVGNVPLSAVDISRATGISGITCEPVSLAPGETIVLSCSNAVITLTQDHAEDGEVVLNATATGFFDGVIATDTDVVTVKVVAVNPERPINVDVVKKADITSGIVEGQNVPYTITVRNLDKDYPTTVDVIDRMPSGLAYVDGSARLDGKRVPVRKEGKDVIVDNVDIPAGGTITVRLIATVVDFDADTRNVAVATDPDDETKVVDTTNTEIDQQKKPEAVFDCPTVIGRVFEDLNGNAWMDDGERGVGSVRVITATGKSLVTDRYGRFSVPCPMMASNIGTNMIFKLDARTLPEGYVVSTENPKVIRLTAGKMTDVTFGISKTAKKAESSKVQTVKIDVDAKAFKDGKVSVKLVKAIEDLMNNANGVEINVEIAYHPVKGESEAQVKGNIAALRAVIRSVSASNNNTSPDMSVRRSN